MKANEAPEKIWIAKYRGTVWMSNPDSISNPDSKKYIEYTRTDAFIEKARKWFEEQNEWFDLNNVRHCGVEDFNDFEKYIRGE